MADWVRILERTPLAEITSLVSSALQKGTLTHREGLAASVVAVNRSCEQVADHHGGPVHPTSGAYAAAWMAEAIARQGPDQHGRPAKPWADLCVLQHMVMTARHIEYGQRLGGPVVMPRLEIGPVTRIGQISDPKAVCRELAEAVQAQHPVRAEKLLLRALELKVARGDLLAALMEEAVPRNVVDDHYFLYPNFAFRTLDVIGWEFAEWPLRGVVRYLATVGPYAKDYHLTGRKFYDTAAESNGPSDYARVHGIAERWGLLREGAVRIAAPGNESEKLAERRLTEQLALEMSDDAEGLDDDAIFHAIAERLGAALSKGMSLQGGLDALSLAAVRLFLSSGVGNPLDVHYLTSITARRHLFAHPEVPARLKVMALLEWASGFEITQRYLWYSETGPGNLRSERRGPFGAPLVPGHAERLLALPPPGGPAEEEGERRPPDDPAGLLDYISRAITVRPAEAFDPEDGQPRGGHDGQMRSLAQGQLSVVKPVCTTDVATRVFPAVWLYDQQAGAGAVDAFFARMAEHVSMDDFTEMHAWKLAIACQEEAALQPREHRWLYMAAAAKGICNHSGVGHVIYDWAAESNPELQDLRLPGWHATGIPRGGERRS